MLHVRRACALAFAIALGAASLGAVSASAAPGDGPGFQGEHGSHDDRDYREGRRAPSAQQRSLAAGPELDTRFSPLGAPAVVTPAEESLATGLPADPATAARAYLRDNRALFGLSEAAVAALEELTVAPLGGGAAVVMRQRFGDLPAAGRSRPPPWPPAAARASGARSRWRASPTWSGSARSPCRRPGTASAAPTRSC